MSDEAVTKDELAKAIAEALRAAKEEAKKEVEAPPDGMPGTVKWVVYLVNQVGMPALLTGFICYLLIAPFPTLQDTFKKQTQEITKAVDNSNQAIEENTKIIKDLKNEIRLLRQDRKPMFGPEGGKKP